MAPPRASASLSPISTTFSKGDLGLDAPRDPAPATVTPVSPSDQPTLSEQTLVSRIRLLFQEAREKRKPIVQQWQKNHRVMRNRTWNASRPAWLPSPEIPEIRPIIGSCVAWVTDSRPKLELTPGAQPGSPFYDFFDSLAQDMKTAINAAWQTYMWESEIEKVVWDAYQYNIGWFKVHWDAALAAGLGDVSLKRRDPWTIYPDPQATCPDDMNYIFEVKRVSLQELDRRFPGAAEKFELHGWIEQADEQPTSPYTTGATMPKANPGAISPATVPRYGLPGQSRDRVQREDQGVTLIEAWLREHVIYDGPSGKKVYECWRCVCIAGPFVLMDKKATELQPFEQHPFVRYTPEDLGEFVGQSVVELLTPAQLAINDILASIQTNIRLVGNPPFVEDTRSGVQRQRITPNQPGQRITVAPGARADWMNVPSMNQMMPEMVRFYIGEMERTSGLSAIAQGIAPGGRLASDVLDSVQESGFVRIRLALRNLEFSLRQIGQMVCAFIAEFYTEPRLATIVGPDHKITKSLQARHFYVSDGRDMVPMRFSVLVYAGSMLPTSRMARIAEADTLFAMNAIDRGALLEAHDWPNRRLIEERMSEMDAKGIVQGPSARQAAGRTV